MKTSRAFASLLLAGLALGATSASAQTPQAELTAPANALRANIADVDPVAPGAPGVPADGAQVPSAATLRPVGIVNVRTPESGTDDATDLALGQRQGVQWDLQFEGGLGISVHNKLPYLGFGRARAGMLVVREPWIVAFGPTFEFGGTAGIGVGGQIDLIHLATGYSLEVGATYAQHVTLMLNASIGYAILAIEWQHLFATTDADALFFKVRIPIGVATFLIIHR